MAVTHVDTSTQPLTPPHPPTLAQQLCSSVSQTQWTRAQATRHVQNSQSLFSPSFYTLIVTLRPDGSISDLF